MCDITRNFLENRANLCNVSEKILTLDAKERRYDVIVVGEEGHVPYNRVFLSSFFEHRNVENLYLNSKDWVRDYCRLLCRLAWQMRN